MRSVTAEVTRNEELNVSSTHSALGTGWFVSKKAASSAAVTIKSKYSIYECCSFQAINLLTTVCVSHSSPCLPPCFPPLLLPVGLRGEQAKGKLQVASQLLVLVLL